MSTLPFARNLPVFLIRIAFVAVAAFVCASADLERGERGMIATVHPLASAAGIEAFRRGGNAIDAAVAAALTLGVVDGFNSGIGGGCFFVARLAGGEIVTIDGRECAPMAASRDMYVRDGKWVPELSQLGALASGVPGSLMTYDSACRRYGKLSLKEHLRYAARIAEDGFRIDDTYAERLLSAASELSLFESARAIFLNQDGSVPGAGGWLRQPDLAKTYRSIAEHGISWFYSGEFAEKTGVWMRGHGGLLTEDDFARYEIRFREPIETEYRGYKITGFPPPSSGGIHVAQILNVLEKFNLKEMGANSPDAIHVIAEAMKLAFADRAYWLGDPDFVEVPLGLISKEYAALQAKRIDMRRVLRVTAHGNPRPGSESSQSRHTTHFTTADSEGNWVACTATVNTTFGSKVVIPGTGVVLNNQMDDFSAQPGVPNYFGLVGSEANAIAPRKRPLSSMSPTIVSREGKPLFSVGAAGGPTIISQVVLAIVNVIDFGMNIEAALDQPRFHHQWSPDELRIEAKAGGVVIGKLKERGHNVISVNSIGAAQAVSFDTESKQFFGAHDSRIPNGRAAGW
ncbi:MAG: gamma-glutamyltransferase [Verrucomicrobia bacterium]|nr:gamma-glutamyltransferase [Verrucomicrobiota bacterium]